MGPLAALGIDSGQAVNHEAATIRAFVRWDRRDRLLALLAKPKRRIDVVRALAHFNAFDVSKISTIPPAQQTPEDIVALLRRRGAGEWCYAISESREFDAKRFVLSEVLGALVGRGIGTVLSCVPGQLAYFEGEGRNSRFLLLATPRQRGGLPNPEGD
jgi:hypothetical protein